MNKWHIFTLLLIILTGCKTLEERKNDKTVQLNIEKTFTFPTSIRALKVVNENEVWFAGSKGIYGYTMDAGKSWNVDSIKVDTIVPHFRSIAVTKNAVFLLSIASPALLFKSVNKGEIWELAYREDHPDVFFDAMAFWDDQEGIAMGDPIGSCLSILITRDGGDHWSRIPCAQLPATVEGEAAFAASNSNIALAGDQAWIVSGAQRARVFHTPDRGRTWSVYDTPISQGGQMTGIFSVDFWDDKHGIIFGGDWNEKENKSNNKAITSDGGRSWQLIADGKEPGYRSHVKYVPKKNGKQIIAVGIPGISYSENGGNQWQLLSQESYYTVDFANANTIWLAGNGKISIGKLAR